MQFEALDRAMRVYETAHDHRVLPGLWMVARLDGRSFTRLVREVRPAPSRRPSTRASAT